MTPRTFKNAAYGHLATVGKALSTPARLEILELLGQAPRSVESIARAIDQSTANTSHHLQQLKRAHLVSSERDGLRVIYALAGPDVAQLVAHLQAVAARHVAALEKLSRTFFDDPAGLEPMDAPTLLAKLRRDEVLLIDVRPSDEYEAGHLPGARSVPLDALEDQLEEFDPDTPIVAYCRGPFCTFSADAVRRLRARGFDARRSEVTAATHTLGDATR